MKAEAFLAAPLVDVAVALAGIYVVTSAALHSTSMRNATTMKAVHEEDEQVKKTTEYWREMENPYASIKVSQLAHRLSSKPLGFE